MEITKRHLILGGGHVAALTLLLLSACGPGGDKRDSGQSPDAGPMADADAGMPDTGLPPDDGGPDLGTMTDLGTDEGTIMCTDEMRLNRVSPPCDPDTRTGAAPGPTGMEGLVGVGLAWSNASGTCRTGMETDPMGRIGILMQCAESYIAPFFGVFYYDLDGLWYANWRNRDQQESARMSFNSDHSLATIELFHAGESVPYLTVNSYPVS